MPQRTDLSYLSTYNLSTVRGVIYFNEHCQKWYAHFPDATGCPEYDPENNN
jgi:hypothetical protein